MKKSRIFLVSLVLMAAFVLGYIASDITIDMGSKAAVIPIKGTISPGSVQASPSSLQKLIKKAENDGVDAYVFQINSPGGTVVASRQMANIIEDIKKPTVCQLQDIAASGAYWIASSCDTIVSDPLTITGSIGVTASYLEYSEHLREEGIEYVRLVKGEFKDMGSPYRNITERERKFFNQSLRKVYQSFVEEVRESRPINKTQLDEITSGRTFLGSVAKKKGMVDVLGGKDKVKEILENRLDSKVSFKNYRNNIGTLGLLDFIGNSQAKKEGQEASSFVIERGFPRLLAMYF
ncbi:MAG: signal peptide peptidase SppA [Candidatus Aenigmatarchaeota archaeon]